MRSSSILFTLYIHDTIFIADKTITFRLVIFSQSHRHREDPSRYDIWLFRVYTHENITHQIRLLDWPKNVGEIINDPIVK